MKQREVESIASTWCLPDERDETIDGTDFINIHKLLLIHSHTENTFCRSALFTEILALQFTSYIYIYLRHKTPTEHRININDVFYNV